LAAAAAVALHQTGKSDVSSYRRSINVSAWETSAMKTTGQSSEHAYVSRRPTCYGCK